MCLRCWKPAHTLVSMEEVHSTETGEKENGKRPLTLPAAQPMTSHAATTGGRDPGYGELESRNQAVTAEMFINAWDQSAVKTGTSHRKDSIERSP